MTRESSWVPPTSTIEFLRRCIQKVPAIASMTLALFLLGGMSAAHAALTITSATWDGKKLVVQGADGRGGQVQVFYGYDTPPNSDSLGTASVKGNGNWKLQINSNRNNPLDPVPCAVSATLDNDTPVLNFPVAGAPADCAPQPPTGNNPPVCAIDTPTGDVTITTGDSVDYTGTVVDPDSGDTVTIDWAFAGGTPANSSAEDPGSVAYDTAGVFTTTLDATDNNGASCVQQSRQITVSDQPVNNPPVVNNPGDQTNNEGDVVSLQIVASDPDAGDILTYSATGLPAGLNIDSATGVISGTIDTGAEANSPYSVTVSVTDDGTPPLTTSVTFSWIVNVGGANNPPTAVDQTFPIDTAVLDRAGPDDILGNAEIPAPGVLLGATDPDGDPLTAELVIGPTGGSLVLNTDGSFEYTPNAATTADSFTYQANDGQALSGVQIVDLTVQTGLVVNPGKNKFNILLNYELGMHCTGFEFAYCCVLPPYNSIIGQVVRTDKGANDSDFPMLLEGDPNVGLDGLGRETVLREPQLDGNNNFQKYVMKYWHEAQPRNDGRGRPQTSTLISAVEANSMFMWNTVYDAAATNADNSLRMTGDTGAPADYNGSVDVVVGDGNYTGANDNYGSGWMNHFYIYSGLEGDNPTDTSAEINKIRLGLENLTAEPAGALPGTAAPSLVVPDDCGPAFHPMGPDTQNGVPGATPVPNDCGGFANGNLLTFSTDHGTVVYTQMKVLENLPVMLTSPRIWEALGLPLTTFEDSIDFFGDPGLVDEDSIRPFVAMKAQLHNYDPNAPGGIGTGVLDDGNPVIGFGTAPIDIPNCERCHSELSPDSQNSAQQDGPGGRNPEVAALVQEEMDFWNGFYGLTPGVDSDWYSRLKGAAISILAIHDNQHGTSFMSNYPGAICANGTGDCEGGPLAINNPLNLPADKLVFPQNTRLGNESVICQKCHADNVIAVVKSANCAPDNPTCAGSLIPPITEAIHDNHRNVSDGGVIIFADNNGNGRDGGCQGCHPAHRSDGEMAGYPITIEGDNFYAAADNRDANGGCFVGRDVHSNPGKDSDGAETPEHLNAVGQYLADNVFSDGAGPGNAGKGIWCTNCHTQLGQEIWRSENMVDLVHGVPGKQADLTTDAVNIRALPTLTDIALAVGLDTNPLCEVSPGVFADPTACAIAMLDPTATNPLGDFTHEIWNPDVPDANVAILEVTGTGGCTAGFVPFLDPTFNVDVCAQIDVDGDPSYRILEGFCTTPDCVTLAQATLTAEDNGGTAVPVPFSAADDARDHWLSPGEPHCADCHSAPYTEQSGNINAFPPFNYPRKASLMRYSRGHQDISCQGCHESIHGLYPVTPTIDTTSYAQAANLNADGSHGPVKCGGCHAVDAAGIPSWIRNNAGGTLGSINNFDDAVGWAHTYTDENSVLNATCQNCHGVNGDNTNDPNSTPDQWFDVRPNHQAYVNHPDQNNKLMPRSMMDKAEIAVNGGVVFGFDMAADGTITPNNVQRNQLCDQCHGNELGDESCDTEWKQHLTEGRVSQALWEDLSSGLTPAGCGW